MRRFTTIVAPLVMILAASTLAGHPMTLEDMALLHNVGSPQMSPDGTTVAVSVSTTDYETFESSGGIDLVDVATGERTRLVEGSSPQWSPDGSRIAYSGREDGKSGLWVIDVESGEKTYLTEIHRSDHFLGHRSRKNWAWSPDGTRIAYIGADGPAPDVDPNAPKVFTRTLYKTRTGFSDDRNVHLWVVAADGSSPAEKRTGGDHDEHSLAWAPDSNTIAFCSNRSADPDMNYSDDIFTIALDTGFVQRITYSPGTETSPSFSPDGTLIAYHGTVRPHNTKDSPPENTQLFVVPVGRTSATCLTESLDRRVSGYTWHPSGESIYFTAGDRGMRPLFRVNLEGGDIERLIEGPFTVGSFSFDAAGESVAVTASAALHPTEVWLADADLADYSMLTDYQTDFMEAVDLQDQEEFWFDSFDGTRVQGFVMKPAGWVAHRKVPTILMVHGGPHGMYSYGFSTRAQHWAARGYGVVYINPRGSTGYGQSFADGCVGEWGGGDYKDLMLGIDHAAAIHDWIDYDRLGVIGGSYGGFMTNWIVTQTDRFKAAVAVASVSNLISFYGTSLYQLLIEVEFNGLPWNNYDLLWHYSPLRHIENCTTPTMLIHGEVDHDVPVGQAEEMYIALKKLGVDTTLVRYPGEGHGFRRTQNRVDYLERATGWFDQYLKGEESSHEP